VSENPNLLNTKYYLRYYTLNKEKQQVDLRIMSEGEKPYLSKVSGGSSPLQFIPSPECNLSIIFSVCNLA